MGHTLIRTTVFAALALTACGGDGDAPPITAVRLHLQYDATAGLDQVSLVASVDGAVIAGPVRNPAMARPLTTGTDTVVVVLDDALAGRVVSFHVDGLAGGVATGMGDTSADLATGTVVEAMLAITTAPVSTNPACSDGIDNDGDGTVDFPADPGCDSPTEDSERCGGAGCPACDNEVDDDLDGHTDAPDDPQCDGPSDTAEADQPACNDGVDNDGDGVTDTADPGCASGTDPSELGTTACDDGIDNDHDGLIDKRVMNGDPGCSSPSDPDEHGTLQCDDGLDNDHDTDIDTGDCGCSTPYDDTESGGCIPGCNDGIDNDGDGLTDYPLDQGCESAADNSEHSNTQCDDGIDNDHDGQIDFPHDTDCVNVLDNKEQP